MATIDQKQRKRRNMLTDAQKHDICQVFIKRARTANDVFPDWASAQEFVLQQTGIEVTAGNLRSLRQNFRLRFDVAHNGSDEARKTERIEALERKVEMLRLFIRAVCRATGVTPDHLPDELREAYSVIFQTSEPE